MPWFVSVAVILAFVTWLLRRAVTNARTRIRKSNVLRHAATTALMHRLEVLTPSLEEGARYQVAGDLLVQGFLAGAVGRASNDREATGEALAFLEALLRTSPDALQSLVDSYTPKPKDLTRIQDTKLDQRTVGNHELFLRVIEEATDLLEAAIRAHPMASSVSPRSVRLCSAQLIQDAFQATRHAPTTTFTLRDHGRQALEDAIRTYGSFPNAVSALAGTREAAW
jgi:hypothetical protein